MLLKTIESHDIKKTLKKGFVLVKQDSKFITRAKNFDDKQDALLDFYDGKIHLKSK